MEAKHNQSNLTADLLRSCVVYDPETGVFASREGKPLGRTDTAGYGVLNLFGVPHKLHRLAWLYVHGVWPQGEIDHINGDKSDNRLANLRDVSRTVNRQNLKRAYKNNKTGYLGVRPDHGRFMAQIGHGGKSIYLGNFGTPEEAHAAYLAAKRKLHEGCTL